MGQTVMGQLEFVFEGARLQPLGDVLLKLTHYLKNPELARHAIIVAGARP
jgi:hypothetical protein